MRVCVLGQDGLGLATVVNVGFQLLECGDAGAHPGKVEALKVLSELPEESLLLQSVLEAMYGQSQRQGNPIRTLIIGAGHTIY